MDQKTALIAASESDGTSEIEDLLMNVITDMSSLLEAIDFMTGAEVCQFFSKLNTFASETSMILLADEESFCVDDDEVLQAKWNGDCKNVVKLKKLALIVLKYMEISKTNSPEMLSIVQTLHDGLMILSDNIPGAISLKVTVSRICEKCWVNKVEDPENYVLQLIPYLVGIALKPNAHDSDVKRLFDIRAALYEFDFEDESIEDMRNLLLRCFIHPAFLRVSSEGRKFLSFIFSINEGLNSLILEVIKPQIAIGTKSVSAAYGEILYRAWKENQGESKPVDSVPGEYENPVSRESLEEFLQTLYHDAIHAADRKYFKGLRISLQVFHDKKSSKGVDNLLLRVYGPILWRSLCCTNALVRAQATIIFFDAFPLQGINNTANECDLLLQKQFNYFYELLKDSDHRVRSAASTGVCHILREFWQVIPINTTHQILKYIICTLGKDSSCPSVRVSVVLGLNELLDQPLSHTILKSLLPQIAETLHDKSVAVRIAFVGILNKVKNIRDFHFLSIVSVEKIQKQLAIDCNRTGLCKAVTQLLVNSYYPEIVTDSRPDPGSMSGSDINKERVMKCFQFTKQNVVASVAFYSALHQYVHVGSIAKFIVLLAGCFTRENYFENILASTVTATTIPPVARIGKRDRNNVDVGEQGLGSDSPGISCGVLKVAVLKIILSCLKSILNKMDDNSESKLFLLKYFTPQSVKIKLDLLKLNIDLENGNPDDDEIIENKNIVSQSIPLLFEIVSLIWKNKKIESPNKNTNTNNYKNILNTFNITYVITEHINSWNMIDQNDQQKLQISISTVKIIKSLSGINHLKTFILESFQNPRTNSKNKNKSDTDGIKLSFLEFCNSPEPTNIRGKNNLKRKPKNISSPAPKVFSENTRAHLSSEFILPIDIAFDLFVALNNDNNVNDENEKEGNDEYQIKIFNIIENIYANTFSTEKNDEKLDILEGSWTVNSGMETVDSEIIINTLIQTFHFRTMCAIKAATGGDKDILNNLISWVKNNLLPYLIKTNTRNIDDDNNGNNNESIAKHRNNYSSEELQFLSPGVKGPPRSKSRQSESPTHSCLFLAKNENLNKENGNKNEREYESSKNKKNNSVRLINFAVHTLETILIVLSDAIIISIALEEITLVLSEIIQKIQDIPIKTRLNSFKILNNTFSRISVLLIPLGEENQLIGAILGKFLKIFENENFENSPIVAPKGKNGKIVRVENYENFTVSVSTFMEDEFQRLSL